MRDLGVDYVVLCIPDTLPEDEPGLAGSLRSGGAAGFLEPVVIDGLSRLKVWRLRPAAG